MTLYHFLYGLSFGGLGLAAYLQLRREGDFPLKRELPWLSAFGFMGASAGWMEMFLLNEPSGTVHEALSILKIVLHLITGLLLLRFGWGILQRLNPLPAWSIFIPGILIVPISFVLTYAATTFITPSPIEIPIEIWTRYLLYLPGSLLAGIGFIRHGHYQKKQGNNDIARLMFGGGFGFLFEAVVMGLIVPAAPYSPASYYNYDRVIYNAFVGENPNVGQTGNLGVWLDAQAILNVTGLPIEVWRMLSAIIVTFFMVKALDVFEAIRKRQLVALQEERDRARQAAIDSQIQARKTAENWTEALVNINRRIVLYHVDEILVDIVKAIRKLLQVDFVGLGIQNQENQLLELKCYANTEEALLIGANPPVISNPLIRNTMDTAISYYSESQEPDGQLEGVTFRTDQQTKAIAVVPLLMERTVIGALWIACYGEQSLSDTDLALLESMADQVIIAIQHGLMTAQLQSLSVIEERTRIAREMHDGLAQVLGYLNLQVQTLSTLLRQGKLENLENELVHMRQAVRTAHADVRENILSLRTTLANEKGLVQAVREYLIEFGIQTGIGTGFDCAVEGELNLSSIGEVQLVCILQEALTNVRKHSMATHVKVAISREHRNGTEEICMQVNDNGIGFTTAGSKRSFGLQTMRERAESANGRLTIQSNRKQGTRIECRLPCLQPEQIHKQSIVIR
ncbi:MAG: GAF domain-containing sensor histidine kinase [Chloroflexota bacterium]